MNFKSVFTILPIVLFAVVSCKNKTETNQKEMNQDLQDNYFMAESELPYSTPDFTKIKTKHYLPAFYEAMRQQNAAIDSIIQNEEQATFENTILALEQSGEMMDRVGNVFWALTSAHTNDDIKAIQEEISPKLSEHSDGITLNADLFERIKTVFNNSSSLEGEDKILVQKYYEDFVKAGANLSDENKAKLKEINSRLATLQTTFNQTLLDANNAGAVKIPSDEQLNGLTESQLKGLKDKEGDGYTISLQNTTQQPLLQSLQNRDIREALYNASINRANQGEFDTSALIKEMAELRADKAQLLGYNNYAEWSLQQTMVKTPEKVMNFFKGLVPAATGKAAVEAEEIQAMIEQSGDNFELAPWDWNLYAEKVRKAKYDLDEEAIKPYFELNNVLENGVFFAAEKLYGITAKPRNDIPTYHEDVKVYELFEEDGEELGLFFTDYFARPSKRGGAWMSNFVTQSHLYNKKPVVYNVMNIQQPADGEAALLTYDEAETMFHEFGHALHGLFANQKYPSISGTAVARDFVEFPSQVNENWALHPEVLANYATHYETGEAMPQALVEKIKNAATFNQGYSLTETLAAANLDMEWHTIDPDLKIADAEKFEDEALSRTGVDAVSAVPPRYHSTYFAHVFGGGYSAGYYSYLWTEMLHHDAYQWFENNGGLTRENGQRFREMVLSQGDTQDYETMYREWRGADPKIEYMEQARGLK